MAHIGKSTRTFGGGIRAWLLAVALLLGASFDASAVGGAPAPHTFSNVGGPLTFDNFPIVPAGRQIIVELTVILDNSPTNAPGTQFVNTAKWDFGTYEIATQ